MKHNRGSARPGTATIARNMWPWTVASDYREPANQRLDMPPHSPVRWANNASSSGLATA